MIPSLGGFTTHYEQARYDGSDHVFLPPRRTLGFNPHLTLNDSLLACSYMEAYDISYPEAVMRIDQEVAELNQQLEAEGSVELHNIGTLSLNEEGNKVFSPCPAGVLTPSLYGLSGVEFQPLVAAQTEDAERQSALEVPIDSVRKDERTISIRVSTIRRVAAACIAGLILFALTAPISKELSLSNIKSSMNTELLSRVMPTNKTTKIESVDKRQSSPAGTVAATNESANAADSQAPCYSIVLASKVSLANAQSFVDRLQGRGFDQAHLYSRNDTHKVLYGTYKTQQEAYRVLRQLHNLKDFRDGWVMKIN